MKQILLLACVLLMACNGKKNEPADDLTKQLIGQWRNTYMKVTMHGVPDSIKTLEVNEADWAQKLKIQPIRTFFNADGTYHSEHRNLSDSIIYNPAGKWKIEGDSITMTDTFPKANLTYRYKLAIKDGQVEFWGKEDFNGDGKTDDYYGKQRKFDK